MNKPVSGLWSTSSPLQTASLGFPGKVPIRHEADKYFIIFRFLPHQMRPGCKRRGEDQLEVIRDELKWRVDFWRGPRLSEGS